MKAIEAVRTGNPPGSFTSKLPVYGRAMAGRRQQRGTPANVAGAC
jgi:hypothetical protein